jgi:hypothetical protein
MKTINKFSALLLLMTAVLLCSYALMRNGSSDASKQINTSNAVERGIVALKFEDGTNVNMDSTIKTRVASCACGQLTVTTKGPDPERRSLCNCHLCQKQTGSVIGVQARFPSEEVTIKGKSNSWKFPGKDGKTVTGRTCADGGVTFHFCPICGSTVYYLIDADKDHIGVKVGAFADPTFPAPIIAGFEEYQFPWANNVSALPMPGGHHQ